VRILALVFGSFLAVVGTMHFVRPGFFVRQVPRYVPHAGTAVLLTGVAEVAIGAALIADWRPRAAGVAAAVLITSYLPVHVEALRTAHACVTTQGGAAVPGERRLCGPRDTSGDP
jgi:uncharacterized membrane protein